jgi:hypothetical protein
MIAMRPNFLVSAENLSIETKYECNSSDKIFKQILRNFAVLLSDYYVF